MLLMFFHGIRSVSSLTVINWWKSSRWNIISNTDRSDQPGTHWRSILVLKMQFSYSIPSEYWVLQYYYGWAQNNN